MPAHSVAHNSAANLASDDEPSSRYGKRTVNRRGTARLGRRIGACLDRRISKCEVHDKPRTSRPTTGPHGHGEIGALAQPGRGRKHGDSRFRATSGRKALTALPTASGEDGAAGASAHAQPKAVGLCAPTVVRLERALAHSGAPRRDSVRPWSHRGRRICRPQVRRNSYGTGPPPTRSNLVQLLLGPAATVSRTHSSHGTQLVENALKHSPRRC